MHSKDTGFPEKSVVVRQSPRSRKNESRDSNSSPPSKSSQSGKRTAASDLEATPSKKSRTVNIENVNGLKNRVEKGDNLSQDSLQTEKHSNSIFHSAPPVNHRPKVDGNGKPAAITKTSKKVVSKDDSSNEEDEADSKITTPKRKRKTKEEKEAEAMPLAARTKGLKVFLGAHVSGAKGVQNSVTNCQHIGGNAFALFLKSQRKWESPPLNPEHATLFKSYCAEYEFDAAKHVLPHGSYLVNLAQPDPEKAQQAYRSFIDDLQRCETLGVKLYNFHPGNTNSQPRSEAIGRLAAALNKAHAATSSVVTVLENMAGTGNVIGSTFEDLRDIIALIKDKSRVGVCIDTCHTHAAGYPLDPPTKFQETMEEFDKKVGIKYLKALHLNDSKAPLASHRDLHQNIGLGFLGLRAFHSVMNESQFEGLPMVLETPIDHKGSNGKVQEDKAIWATEIKLLESLVGMDLDSAKFKKIEKELADRGKEERAKYQEAHSRKIQKQEKDASKGMMKKWLKKSTGESDSD